MIENFDKAIENNTSPECGLVERFEKVNWNYFDLDEIQG